MTPWQDKNTTFDFWMRQMTPRIPKGLCRALQVSFPYVPLSLIGCRASGYSHPICEYDVLVVTKRKEGSVRTIIQDCYVDLHFTTEKALKNALKCEMALTLHHAHHISDPNWLLTVLLSRLRSKGYDGLLSTYLTNRIHSALVKMGRFYEVLSDGKLIDAAYWLNSASYDYSDCVTTINGGVPSPSHTVAQMRDYSRTKTGDSFAVLSKALGMDLATNVSVTRRLEALSIILRVLKGLKQEMQRFPIDWDSGLIMSQHHMKVIENKVRHLIEAHNILEAYCYLGREIVSNIERVYVSYCTANNLAPKHSEILSFLSAQIYPVFRSNDLSMLSLNTEEQTLKASGQDLKRLIGLLSRNSL